MTGTSGPLGRDSVTFAETMRRLHGEIERLVYAAEQACTEAPGELHLCHICAFNVRVSEPICPIEQLRHVIGDHIEQHDIPQVPDHDVICNKIYPRPNCEGKGGFP